MNHSFEKETPVNNTHTERFRRFRCSQRVITMLLGLVAGFVGGVVAFMALPTLEHRMPFLAKHLPQQSSSVRSQNASATKQDIGAEDTAVIATVEAASPAVVSVVISQDVPKLQNRGNGFFGFPFFMMPQGSQDRGATGGNDTEKQTIGQGSGFLVSSDGMIVTNKHVVSSTGADYTVITTDGKEYKAKVLARDPNRDIAVLKIDAQNMPFLEFDNSDTIKVGQSVVAIGNSLGEFSNTVSKGIISGLRRNLVAGGDAGGSEYLSNIIQTDAAINPGNSGGPLLNISGKVIGVNVAMAQGAQSIGFALPANQIKKIIDQVQSTGKITTAYLGVRYSMLTTEIQKENNLAVDHGALILRGEKMTDFAVIPGSPADKAGLMENDVITEIDGVKIDANQQVADVIADHKPGDTLSLTVWHKGETKTVKVTLEEKK